MAPISTMALFTALIVLLKVPVSYLAERRSNEEENSLVQCTLALDLSVDAQDDHKS